MLIQRTKQLLESACEYRSMRVSHATRFTCQVRDLIELEDISHEEARQLKAYGDNCCYCHVMVVARNNDQRI